MSVHFQIQKFFTDYFGQTADRKNDEIKNNRQQKSCYSKTYRYRQNHPCLINGFQHQRKYQTHDEKNAAAVKTYT